MVVRIKWELVFKSNWILSLICHHVDLHSMVISAPMGLWRYLLWKILGLSAVVPKNNSSGMVGKTGTWCRKRSFYPLNLSFLLILLNRYCWYIWLRKCIIFMFDDAFWHFERLNPYKLSIARLYCLRRFGSMDWLSTVVLYCLVKLGNFLQGVKDPCALEVHSETLIATFRKFIECNFGNLISIKKDHLFKVQKCHHFDLCQKAGNEEQHHVLSPFFPLHVSKFLTPLSSSIQEKWP